MNDVGSTLIAHCGARKVSRAELKEIPIPKGTRTHQPLSHYQIVEVLEEALSFRYLQVIRDEYAVSADGMKMFGVMDLNTGFEDGNFSIGLRNSNDKSMRLALTAGFRVMVCDNMAFSGDFTPLLHKHTRNLELRDSISVAVDRIQRGFDPLERRIRAMRELGLTDNDARLFIYGAFIEKAIKGIPRVLMNEVHQNYFEPGEEAFRPRTMWSLSNAFTSAFKQLAPVKQFEVTARLGAYLYEVTKFLGCRSMDESIAAKSPKILDFTTVDGTYRPIVGRVSESSVDDDPPTANDEDDSLEDIVDDMLESNDQRAAA
jgi:hypothetical protein